jgi:ribosome-binding factor A
MIPNKKVKNVKKLQKEATVMKNLALVFHKYVKDNALFHKVSLNRLELSDDGSAVVVYFYSSFGRDLAEQVIKELVPQLPHLRHELAQLLQFRYMPKLVLKYDMHEEKIMHINKKIEDALRLDEEKENKID